MNRSLFKISTLFCLLAFSSCDCTDRNPGWVLDETFDENNNKIVDPDKTTDPDGKEKLTEEDEKEIAEKTVEIEENIPLEHALNERTALATGDDGTLWLAYHNCVTSDCEAVDLTLGQKKVGEDWTFERVKRQEGTFGIELYNDQPVLVFLDPTDDSFKVAMRTGKNEFSFETLPVRRTDPSDGLDIARDGDRVFVTFSNDAGDDISTFVLDDDEWTKVDSLDIGNASAAYERGLQADGNGNLFLVHQNAELWGIAQYSLSEAKWVERSYLDKAGLRPSSLVVGSTDEICIASDVDDSYLSISCGDMDNLEREQWSFPDEQLSSYSSMFRGRNGTLYVAFNSESNATLRLGKRAPNSDWQFKSLFEKSSYGVSTTIDKDGDLIVSYYTCDDSKCSLEVLSGRQ